MSRWVICATIIGHDTIPSKYRGAHHLECTPVPAHKLLYSTYTVGSGGGVDVVSWKVLVQDGFSLCSSTARRKLVPHHAMYGVIARV